MARSDDREHEPTTAVPVSVRPLAGLTSANQPLAAQTAASQPASHWFDGASQHGGGQPRAAKHSIGEHSIGEHNIGEPPSAGSPLALLGGPPQTPYEGPAGSVWDLPVTPGTLGQPSQADLAQARPGGAWPDVCDQFGLHLLVLAEQLRTSLDELEADEAEPERLHRLYQVDHAVTRMRRASRDLRTLAGRSEEDLAGFTTSLLDVIRMAASAIERYTQVSVGRVTELAVLGYAADDVGALMSALLDNATRYSPGTVTVSCHLIEDGSVLFRVEDTGIGIGADQVAELNAIFSGPVPDIDERTGRHTGFPVVHRIARKHSIAVRLASRPMPSSGTVAMVTLPPHLLSEVPAEETRRPPEPAARSRAQPGAQAAMRPSPVSGLSRRERQSPAPEPRVPVQPRVPAEPRVPAAPQRSAVPQTAELPRREPASLRGDSPRPAAEPASPSPQQQEAARQAFAGELSAFAVGSTRPYSTVGETTHNVTEAEEGSQS